MLQTAGHDVILHDVRAEPLTSEQLMSFSQAFGDALLNTKSTTWRGLSEEERSADPLELLARHPALMKRPVIETDTLHLGWTKAVQEALL
jgi:arsenate reductase-like glutaredoxin family protein